MKYDITHKCGCERVVELFGPSAERESKLEYYKNTFCDACKRKIEDETLGIKTPAILNGYWNGKIYGNNVIKSAYIDNIKRDLSEEELKELKTYLQEKQKRMKRPEEKLRS